MRIKSLIDNKCFDNEAVAMLTGNNLVSGTKVIDFYEVGTVTSNKLTLSKTPTGAIVSVYKVNPDGTNGAEYTLGSPGTNATEFSVNAKDITFHTSVTNSTQFRVYYKVTTSSDAKTIRVSSDAFGGTFRGVLKCLVVDEFTKAAFEADLVIPNAKFEDNFNLSFAADGKLIAV